MTRTEAAEMKEEIERMKFIPGKTAVAGPVNLVLDAVLDLIDEHTEEDEC
ncbi:MAG: hypothetical protein IJM27_07800 [Eubacterium sp.]|nr:hypothetical protein [Eubacterium sp.]